MSSFVSRVLARNLRPTSALNSNFRHQIARMASSSPEKKIFITRTIPPKGLELLKERGYTLTHWDHDEPVPRQTLLDSVKGVDALYCLLTEKIDDELLDCAGPQLKVVSTMSVGFDHVDMDACKKRNIPVGNTPDVLTDATAELTVALLLAVSRRVVEGTHKVKDGSWGTWVPLWMCGKGLSGSTVGVVGMGRIGYAVIKRLIPFGVDKIIYTALEELPAANELGAVMTSMDEVLTKSDFVFATCALTPETTGMFNKDVFNKMKTSAVFINTSRGPVVNQDDLYDALVNKEIWGAGLDVTTPEPLSPDHKLLTLDNCVVLPHIASATEETRNEMSALAAKNIIAVFDAEKMPAEILFW